MEAGGEGHEWIPGAVFELPDGVKVTFNQAAPQGPQMLEFRATLAYAHEHANRVIRDSDPAPNLAERS